eukprot:7522628-Heterocapsa_arctica.AAC.1
MAGQWLAADSGPRPHRCIGWQCLVAGNARISRREEVRHRLCRRPTVAGPEHLAANDAQPVSSPAAAQWEEGHARLPSPGGHSQ